MVQEELKAKEECKKAKKEKKAQEVKKQQPEEKLSMTYSKNELKKAEKALDAYFKLLAKAVNEERGMNE